MTTATTDGTPSAVRATNADTPPSDPRGQLSPLFYTAVIGVVLVSVYVGVALTAAWQHAPIPEIAHESVLAVVTLAVLAWLDIRRTAANRSAIEAVGRRMDAIDERLGTVDRHIGQLRAAVDESAAAPGRPTGSRARRARRRPAPQAVERAALTPVEEAELRGMLRGALDRDEHSD